MKTKIVIGGITGWVGSDLHKALIQHPEFELVGGTARNVADNQNHPPIFTELSKAIEQCKPDLYIDYTHASVVEQNVLTAMEHNLPVIIGASGLSDSQYQNIHAMAHKKGIGVIAAGNFSITATLLKLLSVKVAGILPDYEIIEYSSNKKKDAPNGTSRELAHALKECKKNPLHTPINETLGQKESRGATVNQTQIHSIRLPSFSSSNEIIFGMEEERLTISQHAGSSAAPYIAGTLLAAQHVLSQKGLIRGIEPFLNLS